MLGERPAKVKKNVKPFSGVLKTSLYVKDLFSKRRYRLENASAS